MPECRVVGWHHVGERVHIVTNYFRLAKRIFRFPPRGPGQSAGGHCGTGSVTVTVVSHDGVDRTSAWRRPGTQSEQSVSIGERRRSAGRLEGFALQGADSVGHGDGSNGTPETTPDRKQLPAFAPLPVGVVVLDVVLQRLQFGLDVDTHGIARGRPARRGFPVRGEFVLEFGLELACPGEQRL